MAQHVPLWASKVTSEKTELHSSAQSTCILQGEILLQYPYTLLSTYNNGQQRVRSHAHLQAPLDTVGQSACAPHTDHTCGLRRFGRQAGSTPGPQSRLTAHNSEPRKDAAAHNALHARAQRDNRMPRGGRCSNAIDSHHSAPRRRPLRAAHRHAAPPHPSGLPCGAVDRPGLKGTRSSSSA